MLAAKRSLPKVILIEVMGDKNPQSLFCVRMHEKVQLKLKLGFNCIN